MSLNDFVAFASFLCDGVFVLFYLRTAERPRIQTQGRRYLPLLFLAGTLFLYPTGLVPVPDSILVRLFLRVVLCAGCFFFSRMVPLDVAVYGACICTVVYFICQNLFITPLTKPFLMADIPIIPSVGANIALCILIVLSIKMLCYLWICRTIPLRSADPIRSPQVIVLVTIAAASIFIKDVQKAVSDGDSSVNRHPELSVYFIVLQIALLLCLVFFEQYQRKLRENTAYRLQTATAQALLEHLNAQQERDGEIRRLRHDLKNHMLTLRHFLQAGREQDAVQYIDGFLERAGHHELRPQTGHALLDCLISEKLTPAAKSGVEISVVLDFRQGGFLEDFDLCIMIGNALDNAVESCLKLPEGQPRFIEVRGGPSANQMIIHIANSCCEPIRFLGELPVSTKRHGEYHGFGLGNIRRALDKYGGQLILPPQGEGRFLLSMFIPLP